MSSPTFEPLLPEENESLPPARRRRRQRMIVPPGETERAGWLEDLSERLVPSFDFFLFSLLSGVVLAAALLIDSPALMFLAVLVAPFMAPVIGAALGVITGSPRYSLQALGSLLIASAMIFLFGMLAGWTATLLPGRVYTQAAAHSQFTWADLTVLALGAGFSAYLAARSPQQKPLVTSLAIAYSLYLPIGAAGFGAGSGLPGSWPGGLLLFAVHLVLAILIGMLVLAALGLRPLKSVGYLMALVILLLGVGAGFLVQSAGLVGPSPAAGLSPLPATPSAAPSQPVLTPTTAPATPSPRATAAPPTVTPSLTPAPPTPSATATRTLVPSRTPTLTFSPEPTPLWAKISAREGNGVLVREEPTFSATVVQSLINNTLVEIISEPTLSDGATWVKIRTVNDKIGWVVSSLLTTATPPAGQ